MTVPHRVLVVDDSSMMRMLIGRFLADSAFTVVGQATDGDGAVARAAEDAPDIVLMDVVMPGLNSLEALKQMLSVNPRLIVIMASSLGTQQTVHDYLRAGARNFIQKPFTREALLDIVQRTATDWLVEQAKLAV